MAKEILTPEEMRQAERLSGIASLELMESAGQAAARGICAKFSKRKTAVLCGPGGNGGDGYVIARILHDRKWPVQVFASADPRGDAQHMARKWLGETRPLHEFDGAELTIDALYGAGLSRDFPDELAEKIQTNSGRIASIDVPSGLDGLTGKPRGAALRADLTVTFFRKKIAHAMDPGRLFCGEIEVADIGVPDHVLGKIGVCLVENSAMQLPAFAVDAHKYSRGGVLVYSGNQFSTGASRLVAQAAARVGAGAVVICGNAQALQVHAAHLTSTMVKPEKEIDLRKFRAAVIGPGFGVGAPCRKKVLQLLKLDVALVLDADALTSFSDDPEQLFASIKARSNPNTVLTPHHGEFERLFGKAKIHGANKVDLTRAASALSGAIVLFKGPDTIIASQSGQAVINNCGSAKLATAGSGDVLAGLIAGLLAQKQDAFSAACGAAWLHAQAAVHSKLRVPTAEDLLQALQ